MLTPVIWPSIFLAAVAMAMAMELDPTNSLTMELSGRGRVPDSSRPGSAPPRRKSPPPESLRAPRVPSFSEPRADAFPPPQSGAPDAIAPSSRRPSIPPHSELSPRFGDMEAASTAMREMFTILNRLAPTEITVTLTGETGTGKDVLARAIHQRSARAQAPFVIFDCGAIAPHLVEAELFGREDGSVGGPDGHAGAFERARGGTLFFDEVCELPLELQPRLARALESRSVRRVGGSDDRPIDVRILAATNRDLRVGIQSGLFREDLYFRLAATVVTVPPLRDRLDDLPLLVNGVLSSSGRADVTIGPGVVDRLRARSWPGNVRELENVLACALTFVDEGVLEADHLLVSPPEGDASPIDKVPLGGQTLEAIERAAIRQTLALTGGMKVRTAEILGIAVSTLYQKLKKYGL